MFLEWVDLTYDRMPVRKMWDYTIELKERFMLRKREDLFFV